MKVNSFVYFDCFIRLKAECLMEMKQLYYYCDFYFHIVTLCIKNNVPFSLYSINEFTDFKKRSYRY